MRAAFTVVDLKPFVSDADTFLALEPEELGRALLLALNQRTNRAEHFHPANETHSLVDGSNPSYRGANRHAIHTAFMEGFAWLVSQGLVAPDPDAGSMSAGWHFVTRRGQDLTTSEAFNQFRKASALRSEFLHRSIAEKVEALLMRGDCDTAVFQAFKEVEVAVRDASGSAPTDIGVKLMRKAFRPGTGPLADKEAPNGEQQALMDLFAGAIGSYKNPHSHRTVALTDSQEAVEVITLASHLLRIVDSRTN